MIWLAVAACGKSGDGRPAPDQVAGEVVEVAGDVQIEQGGATTAAVVGTKLHGADTVITGADGHVTVLLYHNRARWTLDGGKRKRIDQSVAWRAPRSASGSLLAQGAGDQGTSAAGRHAEKEAVDTRATAPAAEATPAPASATTGAPAPGGAPPPAEPEPAAAVVPPPPPPAPSPAKKRAARHTAHDSTEFKKMDTEMDGVGISNEIGGGSSRHIGTLGKGGGSGSGSGKLSGRSSVTPTVQLGEVKLVGELDRALIRRAVRRHLAQIRHCYELSLVKNVDLAGAMTIDFVVDSKGAVAKATAKGDSALVGAVGSCTTSAFRKIAFPAPKGGGIVNVSYPLSFSVHK